MILPTKENTNDYLTRAYLCSSFLLMMKILILLNIEFVNIEHACDLILIEIILILRFQIVAYL